MNTPLTRLVPLGAFLLTLLLAAPSWAAWYAKFDGVDGSCAEAEEAMLKIQDQMPEPIALLLPAVQKVREAAARVNRTCADDSGAVDADCGAKTLSEAILESESRKPLDLLDLCARGMGKKLKEAKLTCRKAGGEGQEGIELMTVAVIQGLLEECLAAKLPDSVIGPLEEALAQAGQIGDEAPVGERPAEF